MAIEKRLLELGVKLPAPAMPLANYLPFKVVGNQLYLSGMVPLVAGRPMHTGLLGTNVSIADGRDCARVCALNALGWANTALEGQLDRIAEVIRVRGFVACSAGFNEQPTVINGASDLLVDVFGDAGRHTRSVVGCIALPLNVPVEIDFLFSLQ